MSTFGLWPSVLTALLKSWLNESWKTMNHKEKPMKLGAYTACLHDRPIGDALKVLKDLGLNSAEINSGGFLPPVHLPVEDIKSSSGAREEYLGMFDEAGVQLTALNCNGNPLHPDPEVLHGEQLKESIEVAGLLGVKRLVTMSGTPGTGPESRLPAWTVIPWDSAYMDAHEYQWETAVPVWRDIDARARDNDVQVAVEMHPHNIVYNPATMLRLVEEIDSTNVGAEMDPSHLMWQGCDIIAAMEHLGDVIRCTAAKDVRINKASRINGVLDDRFTRMPPGTEGHLSLGGRYYLCKWPENSSWDFVAVGIGHGVDFWADFIRTVQNINPEIPINIEHEDQSMTTMEGLHFAADALLGAAAKV